jgi:hypothetical protein
MSNFKERQASAKKVIQLQNEILSLKQQLKSAPAQIQEPLPCEDCAKLKADIDDLLALNDSTSAELNEEIASLKADLKKVRSENTRLKNKIKDIESEEE